MKIIQKILTVFLILTVSFSYSQTESKNSLVPDKNIHVEFSVPIGGNYTNDHVGMSLGMSYVIGEGLNNATLSTGCSYNKTPTGWHTGLNLTGGLAIKNYKSILSIETGVRTHFNYTSPNITIGFPTLKIRFNKPISDYIGVSAFYKTDGFTFVDSGYERTEIGLGMSILLYK